MSDYIVKDTELTSVANAIRTKGGTNLPLVFPNGFVTAVNNISGGGGDLSIANVTVEDPDEYGVMVRGAYAMPANPIIEYGRTDVLEFSTHFGTKQVIMYKGVALVTFGLEGQSLEIEGDAEQLTDISIGLVKVTGDCTITIS